MVVVVRPSSTRICPRATEEVFVYFFLLFYDMCVSPCCVVLCICVCVCVSVVAPHSCGGTGSNCIWQSHGKLIFCQMREHFSEYVFVIVVVVFSSICLLFACALRSFLTTSACLRSPIGLYSCALLAQLAHCALLLLLLLVPMLRCLGMILVSSF